MEENAIEELRKKEVPEIILRTITQKEAVRMLQKIRLREIKKMTRQMVYRSYLNKDHWKNIRKAKLALDKYRCADCGGKAECVHHKHYYTKGNERPEDLLSLCNECHKKRHGLEKEM